MTVQTVGDWLIFNGLVTAAVCAVLWAWDGLRALGRRIADWNDRDIAQRIHGALDDPATRPMHHWRPTTSLDTREDRHRVNGEES